MLKKEYPTSEELARFRLEYEITRNLQIEGTIEVYELKKHKNTLVMVLEDVSGKTLNTLISQKLDLNEFLKIRRGCFMLNSNPINQNGAMIEIIDTILN